MKVAGDYQRCVRDSNPTLPTTSFSDCCSDQNFSCNDIVTNLRQLFVFL